MIFSIHTDDHVKKANDIYGYAYGYKSIKNFFGKFRYKNKPLTVVENSPASQVQVFYMEPEWYNLDTNLSFRGPKFRKFYDHQYKIYGTHLESTKVWPHWIDSMNSVDEIWVGNNFAAEAVSSSKVKTPVFVFEHGIDDIWKPKLRGRGNKIRFLHVDSGSPRKRADMVERAFNKLFSGNRDVELTLKYHSNQGGGARSVMDLLVNQSGANVKKIFQTLTQEEMVDLYHSHDILVYPSEGEGFGFIPLQALATGMPVISTSRWCSYDKFFKSNIIKSKIGPTSHTGYKHGNVVLAEYQSLLDLMEKVYKDIQNESDFFYKQAPSVYKEYNWQNKCNQFLNSFITRVGPGALGKASGYNKVMYDVQYNGSGKYACSGLTAEGERVSYKFDADNRILCVDKKTYDSLISQNVFSDPS